MASAWILKTARGERAGFVQQAASTLRAKARMDGEGEASLVWGDGDGEIGKAALPLDGLERAFPTAAGRPPDYAYVARDGRLLLCSGERAEVAFRETEARERERRAQSRPPQRRESASPEPPRREAQAQPPKRREAAPPGAMPERRWPPPPAWPKARYVSGRWTGG